MSEQGVLRLASGNAASGRRLGGRWDLAAWAQAAAGLDVDVLAVQEVDHGLRRSGRVDQAAQVAAALEDGNEWSGRFAPAVLGTPGRSSTMRPAGLEGAGLQDLGAELAAEGGYGVALLTRLRVSAWHELRMAPAPTRLPIPDEQRVALAAVLDLPGGRATAVTAHLSFVPRRARAQLRELTAWTASLPRPLVLLGDLNLRGPLPQQVTGWTPGVRGATFPARSPLVQLDHVLLDPGTSGARLIGGRTVRLAGSDHLAVRCDLTGPVDWQ